MNADLTTMPCSSEQRRIWFQEQLAPGSGAYNVHLGTRLSGPLDADMLEQAVQAVVDRHEILRTSLRAIDGAAHQVIQDRVELATPLTDLSDLGDVAGDVRRRAKEHAGAPFALAEAPLVRSDLLRVAAAEHVWLLTMHHAVCDGESVARFLAEVSEAYRALAEGRSVPVAGPSLQYADYSSWQQSELESGRRDAEIGRVVEGLRGAPQLIALPTDRPRPPTASYVGALTEARLTDATDDSVEVVASRCGATRFQVLLTAVVVLLHRLTGENDIVVGVAVDGRSRLELEQVLGCFANTAAIRVQVQPTDTFEDVAERVRAAVIRAQSTADVPFDEVVRRLAPARESSHHAVFQVMVDDQPPRGFALDLEGIEVSEHPVPERNTALFDLGFSFTADAFGERAVAEYATDLFDPDTVETMLEVLASILAAAAGPRVPIGRLPLVDQDTAVAAWSSPVVGDREPESYATVPEAVHAVATATPDATALLEVDTGLELSYRELVEWSGAIAHRLSRAGVGAQDRVVLLLDRSAVAVAAMLGVMQVGAAYVPLAPGTPRSHDLLRQVAPRAVIGAPGCSLDSEIPPVLALDPHPFEGEEDVLGLLPGHPDSAAYLIFTSGSTGTPKGVVVPHRGVLHHARGDASVLGLTAQDRVLHFSELTFDLSAEEIFPCLTVGATLVVRSSSMTDSAERFFGDCRTHGVNVAHLSTSYFHELADGVTGDAVPPTLRRVVIGGEQAWPARVGQWDRQAPWAEVVNAYGPTETTIAVSLGQVTGERAPEHCWRVPLGEPLVGNQVLLLDPDLNLVPPGVVGEMYIGGPGVAQGYFERPGMTAERFVPGPGGRRLFRTGDLARGLPDGRMSFLGRADRQLKIRGYRIEPAEVEDALSRHEAVTSCVVTGWEHDGFTELVGYVVSETARSDLAPLLRAHLAGLLPAYAIPSRVVVLSQLPLTRSEKVDLARLPAPDSQPEEAERKTAPTTSTETVLALVWQEVLGCTAVHREDDFFALGGHSLVATRIISRLKRRHGLRLDLSEVLAHPTLAEQAACVDARVRDAATGPEAQPTLRRMTQAEAMAALADDFGGEP